MAKGKTLKEIRGKSGNFQDKVLQMKIKLENKLDSKQTIFLDRGIPDSISYFKEDGLDAGLVVEESKKNLPYFWA